jgi:hypothetical protein
MRTLAFRGRDAIQRQGRCVTPFLTASEAKSVHTSEKRSLRERLLRRKLMFAVRGNAGDLVAGSFDALRNAGLADLY